MDTSLTIRPARRADVRALTAIRRDAILTLASTKYGSERARDWADSSAEGRVYRAIEQNEVWVAEQSNTPVGWVEIDRDRVEGMYVRPEVSGSGIGSALLLHAEGLIRSAGHRAAVLDASWNAEQFYLRRGYQALAERSADGGRPMLKPLPGGVAQQDGQADVE